MKPKQQELFMDNWSGVAPGEYIRKALEKRGWTQAELAQITNKPLATINRIIQGIHGIKPEMAIALGKAFDTDPKVWMMREAAYQLAKVNNPDDVNDEVERRARVHSIAPIRDMVKRGWINKPRSPADAENTICRFLEISKLGEVPKLLANARSSTPGIGFTSEQTVWLYRAYHLSKIIKVEKYQRVKVPELKDHLRNLCNITKNVSHLPKLLGDFGIKFVVVQHLPKSKIDGAAFWLSPHSPVIALSLRFDRVNYLWHRLSHELSHIYHNDAVIDSDSYAIIQNEVSEAEQRANAEAIEVFLDPLELELFIQRVSPLYTTTKIIQFSNRIGVHPSIVLGQLQFLGELDWSRGTQLHSKYRDILINTAFTDGWGISLPSFN